LFILGEYNGDFTGISLRDPANHSSVISRKGKGKDRPITGHEGPEVE
jgi:hypothetical protein